MAEAISIASKSYSFDVTLDATTGLPNGLANVKEGIVNALISEVTGLLNGGKSASVGMGHTTAEVLKFWGGATIRNMQNGEGVRLNAWSKL